VRKGWERADRGQPWCQRRSERCRNLTRRFPPKKKIGGDGPAGHPAGMLRGRIDCGGKRRGLGLEDKPQVSRLAGKCTSTQASPAWHLLTAAAVMAGAQVPPAQLWRVRYGSRRYLHAVSCVEGATSAASARPRLLVDTSFPPMQTPSGPLDPPNRGSRRLPLDGSRGLGCHGARVTCGACMAGHATGKLVRRAWQARLAANRRYAHYHAIQGRVSKCRQRKSGHQRRATHGVLSSLSWRKSDEDGG
jgi:hypothetical protein